MLLILKLSKLGFREALKSFTKEVCQESSQASTSEMAPSATSSFIVCALTCMATCVEVRIGQASEFTMLVLEMGLMPSVLVPGVSA